MSALADQEVALWHDRAYASLADSHLHRVVREDSLGLVKGRDALTAAWVMRDAHAAMIVHDLNDMVAVRVEGLGTLHRWVEREGTRIARETLIEDFGAGKTARPLHAPLGELRSGQGQCAPGDTATLPPGFPAGARVLADRLHRAWNGRAFDLYTADWLTELCRTLPDATFTFERALIAGETVALLWRVHGHHANGRRVRLIASSVFMGDADDTVIDRAALSAQVAGAIVDYGSA